MSLWERFKYGAWVDQGGPPTFYLERRHDGLPVHYRTDLAPVRWETSRGTAGNAQWGLAHTTTTKGSLGNAPPRPYPSMFLPMQEQSFKKNEGVDVLFLTTSLSQDSPLVFHNWVRRLSPQVQPLPSIARLRKCLPKSVTFILRYIYVYI